MLLVLGTVAYAGQVGLLKTGQDLMTEKPTNPNTQTAIFAGGCFWCLESEFRALDGVLFTESGYIGGTTKNPTYEDVTTGTTHHAEAIRITYDPQKISYQTLLDHFLRKAHDPTQLNRQGVDKGTQYRSAIFYGNDTEHKAAQDTIVRINAEKIYKDPIITTLEAGEPKNPFWVAETYHQQYYEKYKEKTGNDHVRVIYKKMHKIIEK
jgi:peptide-methionine (S)-S-oxide reductase